ncbi:MAG: AMP-binding protein, partial [Hyphomicrobiales bacterium]
MTNHLFDGLLSNKQSDALLARMPDGRHYSYGTALDVSARFANVLVGCGVKLGDRVAVQVPKSIEAAMLYLACVRVGAVFLPLNTAYTADEVEYFLSDAEPSLFICDPNKRDAFDQIISSRNIAIETLGVLTTDGKSAGSFSDKSLAADETFENAECGADSLAAILYTSGTTG